MNFDQPNLEQPKPTQELPKEINIDVKDENEYLADPEELIDLNNPFPSAPEEKDPIVL